MSFQIGVSGTHCCFFKIFLKNSTKNIIQTVLVRTSVRPPLPPTSGTPLLPTSGGPLPLTCFQTPWTPPKLVMQSASTHKQRLSQINYKQIFYITFFSSRKREKENTKIAHHISQITELSVGSQPLKLDLLLLL